MGIAHAVLAAFQLAKKSSKDFFDKLKGMRNGKVVHPFFILKTENL